MRCVVFALALVTTACAVSGERALARPAGGAGAATIVRRGGYPVFEVDGHPFFVYGAAFFYERIPRDEWRADLIALRDIGINTLDLYVIWNWHELADGDFDFEGRTNPRRDLGGLLLMARDLGFKVIVRPGPVIRNEWRNGGYPAWLLERPAYGMPLHDLLEGRYPPTATLQNAHSDDAAAEWLNNATHLSYSRRWLERALEAVADSRADVIAVALDDDQGAYIDNQTWPAPHLAAYLALLERLVRPFTRAPVFINTYEMRVTASAPVWAMGDWYQSDAFAIGEHDRAQLEFSTGLLQTQRLGPVMLSEFQAGWLEQPGDVFPRAADPSNTLLAFHTLLGLGLRGLVNFPAQDTVYPAGWEAPFANAFYAWDAALATDRTLQPRGIPTRRIGGLVRAFGSLLASTHVDADAAIAYTASAFAPERLDGATLDTIAAKTMQAQRACRDASVTCDLVDLRFARAEDLRRYPVVFVPALGRPTDARAFAAPAARALAAYRAGGGRVVAYAGGLTQPRIDAALHGAHRRRAVEALPGGVLLRGDSPGDGEFLVVENYDASTPLRVAGVTVAGEGRGRVDVPTLEVAPRDAVVIPIDVPLGALAPGFRADDRLRSASCAFASANAVDDGLVLRTDPASPACGVRFHVAGGDFTFEVPAGANAVTIGRRGTVHVDSIDGTPLASTAAAPRAATLPIRRDVRTGVALPSTAVGRAEAYAIDAYADGYPVTVLQNARVRVVISPEAGARAFVFEDLATGTSAFTTVGALRDDVLEQPPQSTTDRIAKYTHQFPAGTFNRPYRVEVLESGARAVARFTYDAPDVVPRGATFERTVTLEPDTSTFAVDQRVTFPGADGAPGAGQRAISLSSLAVGDPRATAPWVTITPESRAFLPGESLTVSDGHALGLYDPASRELVIAAWRADGVEQAGLELRTDSVVSRLVLVPDRTAHMVYSFDHASDAEHARARLRTVDEAAQTP